MLKVKGGDEGCDRAGKVIEFFSQAIESMLRNAVDRMDGGRHADSAETIFGLAQGTRGGNPTDLRREAAERLGIATETFRKDHEKVAIAELAEAILANCRDQAMRTERIAMLDKRHPADSRLAINWSERFEDYYRIWTCVYALAADLVAYRLTMLEADRPYDNLAEPGRLLAPLSTETEGYTQEYQAEGYVRFAIYRYATFLAEMHRFQVKRGGFWLLSDNETELKVSDALYRIGWHTPNNERDDSWMRVTMTQAGGELHVFNDLMMRTTIGAATHQEWQEWAAECRCTWDDAKKEGEEVRETESRSASPERKGADQGDLGRERSDAQTSHFATADTDDGISQECALHQVVKACCEYIGLIDADWLQIADWYRMEGQPKRG